MDIRLTQRGKLIPFGGELPVVQTQEGMLNMYFTHAILQTLRDEDLGIAGRVSDIQDPEKSEIVKLEIQQMIIDGIVVSPFGYDFDPAKINVETELTEDNALTLSISYGATTETGTEIRSNFRIEGGDLILEDDEPGSYSLDFNPIVMMEDMVITEPTNIIRIATEASPFVIVSEPGTRPQVGKVTADFSNYPNDERNIVYSYQVSDSRIVTRGLKGQGIVDPDEIDVIEDEIFLRNIAPNIGRKDFIISLKDLKGNITRFEYIDEAEDYVIVINTSDTVVEIEYLYVNGITMAESTETEETVSASIEDYPFPAENIRGAHLVELNQVLDPGVYTVTYMALVKPEYDASLLRS